MKISERTIKRLGEIITGDKALSPEAWLTGRGNGTVEDETGRSAITRSGD